MCTFARKYFGDTFTTHLRTFMKSKCNFDTFFMQLCYLSHSWPNFNIFGIKRYKIELNKSFEILLNTLIYSIIHIYAIKMQFSHNFSQNLAFSKFFNIMCTKEYVLMIKILWGGSFPHQFTHFCTI